MVGVHYNYNCNAEVEELVSIERWSVHVEVDWRRNHSLANH